MRKFVLLAALAAPPAFAADAFDAHTLDVLRTVGDSRVARKAAKATFAELAGQPRAVEGSASALIVVKTDEGNWCKLLVRPSGWKLKGKATPAPMLLIDRLTTYSADPRRGVKADRKDVFLFDGFGIDLDSGQIVPKGSGEDLEFKSGQPITAAAAGEGMTAMAGAPSGPLKGEVAAKDGVEMYLVAAPLAKPAAAATSVRKGPVAPKDFEGVFRLDADGRWTGPLRIKVNADGKLKGEFTSDQTGNVYQATGAVGPAPNHFTLKIEFPRTELELDGYLWTRERLRLGGSAKMEDRVFGFTALRNQ